MSAAFTIGTTGGKPHDGRRWGFGEAQDSWPTRARARAATVHWIEAVYNRQRRHSAIDMLSPIDYEERHWNRRAAV